MTWLSYNTRDSVAVLDAEIAKEANKPEIDDSRAVYAALAARTVNGLTH